MNVFKAMNGEKLNDRVVINGVTYVLVRVIATVPGAVIYKLALPRASQA